MKKNYLLYPLSIPVAAKHIFYLFLFFSFYLLTSNTASAKHLSTAMLDTTITGKVTSSTGEGLAGVSVSIKGSQSGTSTDKDGNFRISVPETGTLVFSSVGFETQELAVSGQTSFSVSLSALTAALEQVVVIGYGAANKRDLTGSISTVKGR